MGHSEELKNLRRHLDEFNEAESRFVRKVRACDIFFSSCNFQKIEDLVEVTQNTTNWSSYKQMFLETCKPIDQKRGRDIFSDVDDTQLSLKVSRQKFKQSLEQAYRINHENTELYVSFITHDLASF